MSYSSYGFDGRTTPSTYQFQAQDSTLTNLLKEIKFLIYEVMPIFQFVYPDIKNTEDVGSVLKSEGKLFWLRTLSEHLRYKSTSIIDSSPISNLFTPPNPSNPFDINNDYNNAEECVRKNPILWALLCWKLSNDPTFAEWIPTYTLVFDSSTLDSLRKLTSRGDYQKIGRCIQDIGKNLVYQLMKNGDDEEFGMFAIFRPVLFPEKYKEASQTQRVSQVYQKTQPSVQPSYAQSPTTLQATPSKALIDLQAELVLLKAEHQKLKTQNADLTSSVEQLNLDLKEKNSSYLEMQGEVGRAFLNSRNSLEKSQMLEKKLNEAIARNQQLVNELQAKDNAIKQLQADLEKYQTKAVPENVKADAERFFAPFMKSNPLKAYTTKDGTNEHFLKAFREMLRHDELFQEIRALLRKDLRNTAGFNNGPTLVEKVRTGSLCLGFLNPSDESFKEVRLFNKKVENYYPIYFMIKKLYLDTSNEDVRTLIKEFLDKTEGLYL